jgi:hypothetical protein
MKKVLLLLFLTFTKCQNISKMNIENKYELNFKIVYRHTLDSTPVLSEFQKSDKNGHEYSRIDVQNPELSFPKKYMELYGVSEELIGRYVSEDGIRDNYFFSIFNDKLKYFSPDSNIVDIIYTQNGNFLKLTSDFIYIIKNDGTQIQYPLKGMKIIVSKNNDIWIIGLNIVWLIQYEYTKISSFEWLGGINTIANNNTISYIDKSKNVIFSLDTKGIRKLDKIVEKTGHFENLAGSWGSKYITLEGSTFRWYDNSVLKGEIILQSAGLLNNEEVFISYTKNKKTYLVTNTICKEWDISKDFKNHILPIVFEKDNYYLGYNLNSYCEFNKNGQKTQELYDINENVYRNTILPYRWKIGQSRYFNFPDYNKLIVSLAGPKEIILIQINNSF